MLRTLLRQVKQYRTAAILTPVWTTAEVIISLSSADLVEDPVYAFPEGGVVTL